MKKKYLKYILYLVIIVFVVFLSSKINFNNKPYLVIPNPNPDSTSSTTDNTQQGYITKLPNLVDSTKVSEATALFLDPSDEWIAKMKKEDERGFYTTADDSMYYVSLATTFLESKKLKIVHTQKRYLDFTKANGSKIYVDRNLADAEAWGVILFDGSKDPSKVDMTVIQSEYEKYFK